MRFFLIFLGVLTTSCRVGPDYERPPTPMPLTYSEDRSDKTENIPDEEFYEWWTLFGDPVLNRLLEEALERSYDYRIALEQVYQARAQYWVQFTQILPEIDGDAQGSRFRTSQSFGKDTDVSTGGAAPAPMPTATLSPFQNFFQCGFDCVWEIDLFGKLNRTAQAAYDTWEATDETARGVKITVLSEVANTYTLIRALQKKVDIARQVVQLDQYLLDMVQDQFQGGLANEQTVEAALATLEGDRANLQVQESALRQAIYSLGILVGRHPETLLSDFEEELPIPHAEGRIPAGLPSDLLRRRPDIRSAERQLAAATEQIGVAVAALFPQLSLTGSSSSFAANPLQGANIGLSSDELNRLFKPKSLIWGIGGIISFPVFDFGKRSAAVDVQVALQHQAYLNYQKTVVTALQEVEQALTAYFHEEVRLKTLQREVRASKKSLDLTIDLFHSGLANYTQLLQVEQVWLAAVNTQTDSEQALTSDLIALYKALGGCW